jgi:hypothetical protein
LPSVLVYHFQLMLRCAWYFHIPRRFLFYFVNFISEYLEVGEATLAGGAADAPEAQGGQVQAAPGCS